VSRVLFETILAWYTVYEVNFETKFTSVESTKGLSARELRAFSRSTAKRLNNEKKVSYPLEVMERHQFISEGFWRFTRSVYGSACSSNFNPKMAAAFSGV
jgi:hypothetical protein